MRALERKVVHTYLADRTDIETHSEGDEPDRRLVVTPVRASSEILTVSRETLSGWPPPRAAEARRRRASTRLLDALEAEPDPPTTVRAAPTRSTAISPTASAGWRSRRSHGATRIADLGAGAGFPGLALAVALPDAQVDLIESDDPQVRGHRPPGGRGRARQRPGARRAGRGLGRGRGPRGLRRGHRARRGAAGGARRVRGAPAARGRRAGGWKGSPRRGRGGARRGGGASSSALAPQEVRHGWSPFDGAAEQRHLHVFTKVGADARQGFPRRPGMARKRPLEVVESVQKSDQVRPRARGPGS